MKALEIGEFEIILREVGRGTKRFAAKRDIVGCLLMHDVGLRVGEACSIEMRDLSHDLRWLTVRPEIAKGRDPNSPRDRMGQTVAVSPRTREAIVDYCQLRGREEGFVLLSTQGKRVHPHHYNALLARISAGHLDTHVHPHMLRHSCGTVLAVDHDKLIAARDQLRHRNVATTNRYASMRPKKLLTDVEEAFG